MTSYVSARGISCKTNTVPQTVTAAKQTSCDEQAVLYVRMSTDMQPNSIDIQIASLTEYAQKNSLNVVEIFSDRGISGLTYRKRPGLKRLMEIVQSGEAYFRHILVLDVSRWGRFQDIDESAYYEFICRKAGVKLHFIAEQFHDQQPMSAILKAIKRSMAAEYSRELSSKVAAAKAKLGRQGYIIGLNGTYGYYRTSVAKDGKIRNVLRAGERKYSADDHVGLVLGRKEEINAVRWIFKKFATEDITYGELAEKLNLKNAPLPLRAKKWTRKYVIGILRNERYIGTHIFGKYKRQLNGTTVLNPASVWTRLPNHWPPIIERGLFDKAQKKMLHYQRKYTSCALWKISDNELLKRLKALLVKHGFLTEELVRKELKYPATYQIIRTRFGGLIKAYQLIGYVSQNDYLHLRTLHFRGRIVANVADELIKKFLEKQISVTKLQSNPTLLRISDIFCLSIAVLWCLNPKASSAYQRWQVNISSKHLRAEFLLIVRLDNFNKKITDYYLIPSKNISNVSLQIPGNDETLIEPFRLENFDMVCLTLIKNEDTSGFIERMP